MGLRELACPGVYTPASSRVTWTGTRTISRVPDPKETLRTAILTAADASGRKRDNLRRDLPKRIHRVAELIDDYSPLRALASFQQLESDLRTAIGELLRTPHPG